MILVGPTRAQALALFDDSYRVDDYNGPYFRVGSMFVCRVCRVQIAIAPGTSDMHCNRLCQHIRERTWWWYPNQHRKPTILVSAEWRDCATRPLAWRPCLFVMASPHSERLLRLHSAVATRSIEHIAKQVGFDPKTLATASWQIMGYLR